MKKLDLTSAWVHRPTRGAISLEVTADRVEVDLDPSVALVAEALAKVIHDLIAGITAKGADGHTLFNRTGTFLKGIRATALGVGSWAVSVGADRLNDTRAPIILARLLELVPELSNAASLVDRPSVKAAIAKVVSGMVTVTRRVR